MWSVHLTHSGGISSLTGLVSSFFTPPLCPGARFCTRENPAKQRGGNAIPGLHSSWVGDSVLAIARPWQEYIHKYSLVDAFLRANIGMILNLQEVGEHDSCGPGNLPSSGFSYEPESFTAARIGFYNFSWRDMGVPDLYRMMDIVQVCMHLIMHGRMGAGHECMDLRAWIWTA